MAFQIKDATEVNKDNLLNDGSRYQKSRVIYYGPVPKTTFEIYKRGIISVGTERVALINAGWEYRPDLVSFDLYGTPDFWWRLMEINGMKDILEFKSGVTLKIPTNLGV